MGLEYHCGGCDVRVVLENSGPTATTVICRYCNCEMEYTDTIETEYIGDVNEFDDYQIATNE
jgi:hypothetical protein